MASDSATEHIDHSVNQDQFRDALSAVLIEKLATPRTKSSRRSKGSSGKGQLHAPVQPEETSKNDAAELAEFVEYIADETFVCLPEELQSLTHRVWAENTELQERYALPLTGQDIPEALPALDPSVADSLQSYGVIDGARVGVYELLAPVLTAYITAVTTPPPPPSSTRGRVTACEICGRDWINLTYHHLIPRFVHAKVVKRGWHRADELQNVAWLCGACHRFVHQFASHEDLARHYYTVDLLLEQDEVVAFAKWVGKLRWKKR